MIKVKPLVWYHNPNYDENTICADIFYLQDTELKFIISCYENQYELQLEERVRKNETWSCLEMFNTIEQAKEYAYQWWNEYVLSLIEVYPSASTLSMDKVAELVEPSTPFFD